MSQITKRTGSVATANSSTPSQQITTLFAPAAPALQAAQNLKPVFEWKQAQPEYSMHPMSVASLDRFREQNRAKAQKWMAAIPEDGILYRAHAVFGEAEFDPAPERWTSAAIGMMLELMPTADKVSPYYRAGLLDMIMNDPEVVGSYEPGFSYAVIVQTIREARRKSNFVPSAKEFLDLCIRHRKLFERYRIDTDRLITLRQNAEDILEATGDLKSEHGNDAVPF